MRKETIIKWRLLLPYLGRRLIIPFLILMLLLLAKSIPSVSPALDSNKRYLIVRIHRLGLANRLRCMADWYQIAARANRHLLVSWAATPDCNISFPELFIGGSEGWIEWQLIPESLTITPFFITKTGFSVLQRPLGNGQEGVNEVTLATEYSNLSFKVLCFWIP